MAELAGPRGLRKLLDAVMTISADLDLESMLRRITERAAELVDARYAALGVLNEDRSGLSEFITVGASDEMHRRIGHLPEGHGILGVLIVDAKPLRLPDLKEHPDSYGFPPGHPPMSSFLGVPIRLRDEVFGNLYLTDKTSAEVFSDIDEELVVGLAAAAGVAIENARLHALMRDYALLEERDRIARDLHDTVIQRLFATGLSLQGAVPLVRDPTVVTRLESAVDDLDVTVKQIRSAIFGLTIAGAPGDGLRSHVVRFCEEASRALGFRPRTFFEGPIDIDVSSDVANDLLATLREALTNVVRHAGATRVDVSVAVGDGQVRLRVVDDGRGVASLDAPSGYGLQNITARAARHGGRVEIDRVADGGTCVDWIVPTRR